MKSRKTYLNCKLASIPYLLPYGQGIVDHAFGLQTNDTSTRLWDALNRGSDRDSLLALLQADCEASAEDIPKLQQDLDEFLTELSHQGAILPNAACSPYQEHLAQIGPLVLSLQVPDALWERYFLDFACPSNTQMPHQHICIYPQSPAFRENGTILVRSKDLMIAETEDTYLFLPLTGTALKEMHVAKDGSLAELYCSTPTDSDIEELFHAIRFAFLIAAAQHNLYALHSASILYRDRAWLFSGPSGAGKSTHTGLWKASFGTTILNGDLNLLGMEDSVPMCYGLPWNGTSGIRTVGSWPLGGVTFLKKSLADEVQALTPDKKILYLSQRLISPAWTAGQLKQNLTFCDHLAACTPMFVLYCTREPHAAQVMQETIDLALS